jgi:two-component system, chemotaxis family, sensor kinase Cph1
VKTERRSMSDSVTTSARLPWDGQPYSIKRHGVSITNCDSEPVQTPGCIQSHGALLVLRPADMTILQASENAMAFLGIPAQALLGQPVATVLGEEHQARLRAYLRDEPTDRNPLYVFTQAGRGSMPPLDVTVHTIAGVAIVELEVSSRNGEAEPDYFALVKKTMVRLQETSSLQQFCNVVTQEIRALTGLDRVMVYKFHADDHGEVFAESRRADLSPWLGLHYPAEDIPKPARDIFSKTWVRPLPDVSGGLAELLPLVNPDTGMPLDMTYCALRGASVMYTEYLSNLNVTAGLTLPIRRGDKLWGLIACHHYSGPKHLLAPLRAACEFVAQVVSLQHQSAEDREAMGYRLHIDDVHQRVLAAASREGGLCALTEGSATLSGGIDAGGVASLHNGRWWRIGATPSDAELNGLAVWISGLPAMAAGAKLVYATDRLGAQYPAATAFASVASGLLAASLSREGKQLILWFRPETLQTVNWGGNPQDKPTAMGSHGPRLTPRRSFELFVESVYQRSLPWRDVELEAAARLRVQLAELVVSQAERLADLNAELSRSNEELDAFAYVASHDLKEPLRGIHKYAHQLLQDDALISDGENRRKLEGLTRLTIRMDGLLDSLLHFSRVGRADLRLQEIDFNAVLDEAIEMVGSRTAQNAPDFVVPRTLPVVTGDWVRCREVLVNLLSNALKYSDQAKRRIEIGYIARHDATPRPRCPEEAAPHTIFYVKDNGIGIAPEYFEQVFKMFKRLNGRDEYGGGTGAGLTIARKLVERHHGQIWLDSSPGNGTTFYFTLPTEEVSA